jgi:PmbA protein
MMLEPARAREILQIAGLEANKHGVREVELIAVETSEALTRFANNTIHQNVAELVHMISIRTQADHRTARATTNRLDTASIRTAVQQAIAMMRSQDPDEHLLPMSPAAPIEPVDRWCQATADCSPRERAHRVKEAIAIAESARQTAAGILSTEFSAHALLNTNGVEAMHRQTMSIFSMTAMAEDSSGWAKQSCVDIADLDVAALALRASSKAKISAKPAEVAPGEYTVILEPAAVLDLVGQIFQDFSGTAIEDQRSFLTTRLGEKIFGANISVSDDARHPLQAGEPFDGEGVPKKRLLLVDAGVPRDVAFSRGAAHRNRVQPTGHGLPLPNEAGELPVNIVIAGGNATLEEMIASTGRGLLVTRLWYIREVEPFEKVMTGMTRDGTFLIENGQIAGGIRNMRFNQSVVAMLNNVRMLGEPVRASGEEMFDMVVPAMKIDGFRFTEVTRF